MTQREVVFKYQPGDLCWFYLPGNEGLTPGTVQIGFQHPWHVHPHYIIQVHDPAYLYFECRDEYTMTNDPSVLPAYSGANVTDTPIQGFTQTSAEIDGLN